MSKQSLAWHEECYANRSKKTALDRRLVVQTFEESMANIRRAEEELNFYAKQIGEAKWRGKDSFDRDRFLVKKGHHAHA